MVTVRNSVVGHRTGDWFVRDVPTVADSLFLVTQSLIHKFHIFCGKDDIARFSNENVVASMNPHHAVTTFHNYLTERIGPERAEYAYAWNAFRSSNAQLVFGSDWPTAPLSPYTQIWAAVFRESAFGKVTGGWHLENAVSFEEALYAYSQAPATASGW